MTLSDKELYFRQHQLYVCCKDIPFYQMDRQFVNHLGLSTNFLSPHHDFNFIVRCHYQSILRAELNLK